MKQQSMQQMMEKIKAQQAAARGSMPGSTALAVPPAAQPGMLALPAAPAAPHTAGQVEGQQQGQLSAGMAPQPGQPAPAGTLQSQQPLQQCPQAAPAGLAQAAPQALQQGGAPAGLAQAAPQALQQGQPAPAGLA